MNKSPLAMLRTVVLDAWTILKEGIALSKLWRQTPRYRQTRLPSRFRSLLGRLNSLEHELRRVDKDISLIGHRYKHLDVLLRMKGRESGPLYDELRARLGDVRERLSKITEGLDVEIDRYIGDVEFSGRTKAPWSEFEADEYGYGLLFGVSWFGMFVFLLFYPLWGIPLDAASSAIAAAAILLTVVFSIYLAYTAAVRYREPWKKLSALSVSLILAYECSLVIAPLTAHLCR